MTRPKPGARRCAIYTRKSSEEGLEQDFNSLHAQRQACEAYIRSQQGEGWRVLDTAYDDGGLSGGTLDRPALQRLLADIAAGRIDTVVVYKVDRLTRSLFDFAKLVEIFDRHGVSFIAVTQQFNTTTSMGRLTLNVLLSFAQFEREVTGDRIRDKIAASKRKGMWMGGVTPLGYVVRDRKLVVEPDEAATVRRIFRRYLEVGSVAKLQTDLDRQGVRSKTRVYQDGRSTGGCAFSRGALYALLSNPLYVGEFRHKELRHRGLHAPIVDRRLWEAVQQQLQFQAGKPRGRSSTPSDSPLIGRLFDEQGGRLTPSHSTKAGRRYRYYVSHRLVKGGSDAKGWRLPAEQFERLVAAHAGAMLDDRPSVAAALEQAELPTRQLPTALAAADALRTRLRSDSARNTALVELVRRVDLQPGSIRLTLSLQPIGGMVADLTRDLPLHIKRRGVELRLVVEPSDPNPAKADPTLLKELTRAHRCFDALLSGMTIAQLADREGVDDRYISTVLPLAFLAPDIVEAIVAGRQPVDLTATRLIRRLDLAIDWETQRRQLGFT